MRWLADVALHKFDEDYNMHAGTPAGLKFQNGVEINYMAQNIQEELTDDVHIWVVFKDDMIEVKKEPQARTRRKVAWEKRNEMESFI